MSGNTLTHLAGKNLPAAVQLALKGYATAVEVPAGDSYEYWQSQADAAATCARELDYAGDDAFADRNFDLLEQIQSIADEYAARARDFQDRADDAFLDAHQRPRTVTFQCLVTAQGRRLLNLLSHDPSRTAAAALIAFVGQTELDDTLADLHTCQLGQFEKIRPVTFKRGLITGAPVPVTHTQGRATA